MPETMEVTRAGNTREGVRLNRRPEVEFDAKPYSSSQSEVQFSKHIDDAPSRKDEAQRRMSESDDSRSTIDSSRSGFRQS